MERKYVGHQSDGLVTTPTELSRLCGFWFKGTGILFFGPCIFIIEGRTDQQNAQINFGLINLLLKEEQTNEMHKLILD